MTAHNYSNTAAVAQVGSGGIDPTATVLPVNLAGFTGFPVAPFWIEVGQGTASAEIMEVTSVSGTNLTVTRGQGGTSAIAHNAGDSITHIVPASHFQDAEAHEAASTSVHGVPAGASVVGTTGSQTVQDKAFRGGFRHAYSDTNPPALSAAVEVDADNADAEDAFVVHNTAADPDRRAFLLDQSGTPRVQVFQDGTVDLAPSGTGRPGLRNHGTTQLDGAVTVAGELDVSGTSHFTGPATVDALTVVTGTVEGDLSLPAPSDEGDVSDRILVAGNTGQALLRGTLAGVEKIRVTADGDVVAGRNVTATGTLTVANNKITTAVSNDNNDFTVQGTYRESDGTTVRLRDLRQPLTWGVRDSHANASITVTDAQLWSVSFTPRTNSELEINLAVELSRPGTTASESALEVILGWKLNNAANTSTIVAGDVQYRWEGVSDANAAAQGVITMSDLVGTVTAGTTYTFVIHGSSNTPLHPNLDAVHGVFREVAFLGWLINQ